MDPENTQDTGGVVAPEVKVETTTDKIRAAVTKSLELHHPDESDSEEAGKKKVIPKGDVKGTEKEGPEPEKKPEPKPKKEAPKIEKDDIKKDGGEAEEGKTKAIPPRYLSEEEKKEYEKTPPLIKQAFTRREQELGNAANKINTELGQARKKLEAVDPVLEVASKETETLNAMFKAQGINHKIAPPEYIKHIIEADKFARADPASYILAFAKNNKVDLAEIVNGDPAIAFDKKSQTEAIERARLQARVEALEAEKQAQVEGNSKQQTDGIHNEIQGLINSITPELTDSERRRVDILAADLFPEVEEEYIKSGAQATIRDVVEESVRRAKSFIPRLAEEKRAKEEEAKRNRSTLSSSASISPRSTRSAVSEPLSLRERVEQNMKKFGVI